MEKTAKFVLEYEVKIDQKDKNNLNGLVSAIQEVLEVGQIIMLPLRKTQKTIILDGRKISVLESEVDTRKAVRVLRMI